MGGFLSRGPAASDQQGLKESEHKPLKGPTETKKRPTKRKDGRSYAEVVAAGPETGAMSKLRKPSAAWKFVAAPQNKQVQVQERLPD